MNPTRPLPRLPVAFGWLAVALAIALARGAAATAAPDFTALKSRGGIVIEAEAPAAGAFAVSGTDPVFTDPRGAPREFPPLSGGRACLLFSAAKPAAEQSRARYDFTAETAGEFYLWAYENGRQWSSPFRWRIGGGAWTAAAISGAMLNAERLAADGPMFAWSCLGKVGLPAGRGTLEIEVVGPRTTGGYLFSADLFVFAPAALPVGVPRPPFSSAREQPPADAMFLYDRDPAPGSPLVDDFRPRLDPFLLGGTTPARGAVVVCPGGGYRLRAAHESAPVAEAFRARGFHAFVLQYRLKPHPYEAAAMDVARAIRWVRGNAEKLGIRPDRIAVCGFSAGGHLAATAGVHYDKPFVNAGDAPDATDARPNALVLVYPWIPARAEVEQPETVAGAATDPHLLCVADYVTDRTPPAFLVHAADDRLPVEGSWRFGAALGARKIPWELHVFPAGGHGFGLAPQNPYLGRWPDWAAEWLSRQVWKTDAARPGREE